MALDRAGGQPRLAIVPARFDDIGSSHPPIFCSLAVEDREIAKQVLEADRIVPRVVGQPLVAAEFRKQLERLAGLEGGLAVPDTAPFAHFAEFLGANAEKGRVWISELCRPRAHGSAIVCSRAL